MSVYLPLEYHGTGVNLADVLPVPRCRLPLGSKQNLRSRIRGPQNNRPGRKSRGSPLETLRRQDERGEDEQPSDSHADALKACLLPGVFAVFLALAYHKRDVQPTRPGVIDLRTRELRKYHWQSGTPKRQDLWDTFMDSQQNSHSRSSRPHYADSLGGDIHLHKRQSVQKPLEWR